MLLTEAEVRTHITTSLVSAALQRLIDAAEDVIDDAIGPVGNVSEVFTAGPGDLIALSHRATAIVTVNENEVALVSADYELLSNGRFLRRKLTGATSPDSRWRGRVLVTYTPVSDVDRRKVAQLALIDLGIDTTNAGAVQSERIGDWTETFSSSNETRERRDDILAALTGRLVII